MSRVYVADDKKGVTDKVTSLFEEALTKPRTGAEGFFTVGLSGGSAVAITIHVLKQLHIDDFQKWRFFFCDERVVPFDHPESTFGAFRSQISTVPGLAEAFFVPINPALPLEDCERDYALRLKQYFPGRKLPDLDICVLGMGPDGHTCSLFPHHDLLTESKRWVAAIADSPKPPAQRITLTLPVLNAAKNSGGTQKAGDTKSSTKQDECPLDREQLGRHTWNFLHTMAAYYPQHPSKVDQRRMESFLTSLGYFYPCDHCAEDFREEMKKSPPKVASRSELSRWLCDQHNVVNRKLGKKEFDCSKVFERWLTGPTDGSC